VILVAALFVDARGAYSGLADVDLWDETRDARLYPGPHPVVAHPPCSRWCRLAGLVEARWGHRRGDDGDCFASALDNVRRWGGVLEHPAHSDAWIKFGLPEPDRHGGWLKTFCGGWTCYVEQVRYGHMARKGTWLYAHGVKPPSMRWGHSIDSPADWRTGAKRRALVGWCKNHGLEHDTRPRVGKKAAAATPIEFRDALLEIARSARPARAPAGTPPTVANDSQPNAPRRGRSG
jgi:hypothetical protein